MTEPKAQVSMTNQQAQGSTLNLKLNKTTYEIYRKMNTKICEKLSSSTLTETSPIFFIFLSLYSFYF